MRDFTLQAYKDLLIALQHSAYQFLTFEQYCIAKQTNSSLPEKVVILRHDVDLKAANSLATAQLEAELGIVASYYFRVVPQSNQPEIITQIAALGHEIGYHYEDMGIFNGNHVQAIAHFEQQLAYFRTYYPVKTICMHGNPTSKWDSKDLWKHADYKDYGIIGEPYYDIDFSQFFYLTDTGRCWDGYNVSVRDKVPLHQDNWNSRGLKFHSTYDIIKGIENGLLAKEGINQIMITTHPQRWTNSNKEWILEFIIQNLKNTIKYILSKRNK